MEQKKKSRFSNPLINKALKTVSEFTADNENSATYAGISKKCAFYIIIAILGFVVLMVLNEILPATIVLKSENGTVTTNGTIVIVGIVSMIVFIVISIVSIFAYKALPILGFISMACMGFMLGFIGCVLPNLKGAMLLAVVITIALFIAMLVLYNTGLIKVTSKFKKVIFILIAGSVILTIFLLICRFVRPLYSIYAAFALNPVVGIIGSLIGLVIATLFLISDFDNIHNAVTGQLPKQYEWLLAYSLAFSIMWVFLKVFQLIARAKGSSSSSKF